MLGGISSASPTSDTASATASSSAASTSAGATPAGTSSTVPALSSAPGSAQRTYAAASTHPAGGAVTSSSSPAAPKTSTSHAAVLVKGVRLPLGYSTGTATRVITVVASSRSNTTATLQAWNKAPGGGWLKRGSAITAHIGSDGMTTSASESMSATPEGTFTLTQAFGRDSNPGTGLPYLKTRPGDWWISQSGSLYNTHQYCTSGCAFRLGSPNEHLYYETPFYNYAVVIDYNTRNAPGGVRQGAGSAFFLHVTDGHATAGCVAIPSANLVSIMKWLTPSAHPRILIGVA
jgi:L,D-peptidoglycan transpeptidase YkuD (ErfK/YbiS/YcfS/YnhG family)